jgi:hypothetical protein
VLHIAILLLPRRFGLLPGHGLLIAGVSKQYSFYEVGMYTRLLLCFEGLRWDNFVRCYMNNLLNYLKCKEAQQNLLELAASTLLVSEPWWWRMSPSEKCRLVCTAWRGCQPERILQNLASVKAWILNLKKFNHICSYLIYFTLYTCLLLVILTVCLFHMYCKRR